MKQNRRWAFVSALVASAGFAASMPASAHAGTVGFVANPTGNSSDWTSFVTGLGGAVNSHVDFNTHALGALNPNFYSVSDGVTFSSTASLFVDQGTAYTPGNPSGPLSTGEGLHDTSHFLRFPFVTNESLTINFASQVLGAGFFLIDPFNPAGNPLRNPATIQAFTDVGGTGTLLGTFELAQFNFGPNFTVFLGIASTAGDIRSIRFNDFPANAGDGVSMDGIRFATAGVSAVPLPRGALLGFALMSALGVARAIRRRPFGARSATTASD